MIFHFKIVVTVSCGGNILVNVGPTKEGTIIPIFEERLGQMGSWLKMNGEAIYKSKPWIHQNDTINSHVWYTSTDDSVFAISLQWPENGILKLGSVRMSNNSQIHILGLNEKLQFEQKEAELDIFLPDFYRLFKICNPCQWGFVLKIEFADPKIVIL